MSKNLKIYSNLKKIFSERTDILDVILFGSVAKGKTEPGDIDICIIFREKIDKELINKLNKEFEHIHFSVLTADNFFKNPHSLIRAILFEGISLITDKKLSEIYRLDAYALFSYDIKDLENSKKVRFLYAIKGRKNQNGFVKDLCGKFIATNAFVIPVQKDREMIEILEAWNIKFERKQIYLMS